MNIPPPPEWLSKSENFSQKEYEEIFSEEWNKIFPKGINYSIDKMVDFFKQAGILEEMQNAIGRSLAIMEGKEWKEDNAN